MITQNIIEKANELALKEIVKYNHPSSFDEVNKKGQELAKKLKERNI